MPRAVVFWVVCLCPWVWTPAVAESSCPAIPKRAKALQQWAKEDANEVFEQLKTDMKVVEAAVGEQSSFTAGATGRLKVGEALLVRTLECENLSFVACAGLSQPDVVRRHICGQHLLHSTPCQSRDPRAVAQCRGSARYPRPSAQKDGRAEAR